MKECYKRLKRKASKEGNGKGGTLICIVPIAIHFAIRVVGPKEVIMLNVV